MARSTIVGTERNGAGAFAGPHAGSLAGTLATFLALAVALPVALPVAATAQDAGDFYKGRTISILVGAGEGGSFVPYAQVLAEHMKRHIPGSPNIIVKTMGGQGGGLDTAIQMQNTQPRDGTVMAMTQQTIVLSQVINPEFARFDARTWNWVGNMATIRNMLAVWHTAKGQSIDLIKQHETIAGATGPSSPTYIMPSFLNRFAGTKFKIVTGYKGTADLNLAMQRGEIEVRGGSWLSVELALPDEIKTKKIKPLVFASIERDPGNKDVPTLAELVTDPKAKQAAEFISAEASFGRAFFMPPNVPADRVAIIRRAFDAALKDPELIADAKKKNLPLEPIGWEELTKVTAKVIATPKEIAELAK
jgi:tripartite-type tricarboxylate transporter receptor subunit TctC